MRKLGEQWIEVIDGQEHMKKLIWFEDDMSEIVKDLGILRDGLLPSPFIDNKYPRVTTFPVSYCWLTEISDGVVCVRGTGENGEESYRRASDAWNRRV